jgi:hypothetical protein
LTKNSKERRNDGETALGFLQPGPFIGNCFNCGMSGHRSFECPSNTTASSGGKKYEQEDCGILGHATEDCWEDPKNEGKRPNNWVSRKKRKNGEANGSHVEIVLKVGKKNSMVLRFLWLEVHEQERKEYGSRFLWLKVHEQEKNMVLRFLWLKAHEQYWVCK